MALDELDETGETGEMGEAVDLAAEDVADSASDETLDESAAQPPSQPTSQPASMTRAHRTVADPLYGALPISRWAQALLETAPFARLAGVSLSDVPGELLMRRAFPSRLTHSLGVYFLARQARPRDRALHAAALAHDLGHGPFSHLSEPLMIERLGLDHERRGAQALRQMVDGLRGASARLLAWLDVDEVAALMLGEGPDGRGKLLNGLMDYDNLDNVARFLQAAGLGVPSYDPRALARELRLLAPLESSQETSQNAGQDAATSPVALAPEAATLAQAWQADRRRVYRYLSQGERNIAMHGMLRKAVDLAALAGLIADDFFDATDAEALRLLRSAAAPDAAALAEAVIRDALYTVAWEATAPDNADTDADALDALFAQWRTRLALEERVASEAGLLPHEVALSYTIARGERALPPIIAATPARERDRAQPAFSVSARPASLRAAVEPERGVLLLIAPTAGRDYARRARMAAERALGSLGLTPRGWASLR